jgi:hypothetical protein
MSSGIQVASTAIEMRRPFRGGCDGGQSPHRRWSHPNGGPPSKGAKGLSLTSIVHHLPIMPTWLPAAAREPLLLIRV